MKILVIDSSSKRPLANTKIQLQVKGKDSGFISLTTDGTGSLMLDSKYQGQQIMATSSTGSQPGQWLTANEGATLTLTTTKQKSTETGSTK